MFEKYLQDIGLNDKEASIYLALLGFENASALDLANKTKIKRPTVYVILESLAKKGLVSETTVGKKTHYYAEIPEKLETFIDRKMVALNESKKVLKDLIPQLKSLSREQGEKPVVKYFEGKEGVISSTDEAFSGNDESDEPMYSIYPNDLVEEIFTSEELKVLRSKRVKRNINSKAIYTYEKGERPSSETADRIKVDGKKYPITSNIVVYKDTVLISTLGKRISSILIKNQDVAETIKSLFNIAFDKLKS